MLKRVVHIVTAGLRSINQWLRTRRPENRGSILGGGIDLSFQASFWVHTGSYPEVTGALSTGVKKTWLEANNSPPPNAEVKNSYTSTPSMPGT
jgi:hypothetical protein